MLAVIITICSLTIMIMYFVLFRTLYSSDTVIKGNENIKANKLMIVAHPDDELLFGGSELINEKGWFVICITNGSPKSKNIFSKYSSKSRVEEFKNVMDQLECKYEIWDFEDSAFNSNWNVSLKNKLEKLLEVDFKKVVTHNLKGEYGHKQHKKISEIVHNINPKNLYVFDTDEDIENTHMDRLTDLLSVYWTQKHTIDKYIYYAKHQTTKKVVR